MVSQVLVQGSLSWQLAIIIRLHKIIRYFMVCDFSIFENLT